MKKIIVILFAVIVQLVGSVLFADNVNDPKVYQLKVWTPIIIRNSTFTFDNDFSIPQNQHTIQMGSNCDIGFYYSSGKFDISKNEKVYASFVTVEDDEIRLAFAHTIPFKNPHKIDGFWISCRFPNARGVTFKQLEATLNHIGHFTL